MKAKYVPGGHGCILGLINICVHTLMYGYYLLIIFKPELKHSFWKKFITQIQISQFIFLIFHFAGPLFFPAPYCTYSKIMLVLGLTQNIVMLILFLKFYIENYVNKGKSKEKKL